ncbi:ATP-binding protein [Limnohabitans sp.]|uniref:ATP-binding protein n=1 Tax=Limnohabitans sp. TaxID=1907725 RepID=UPI0033424E0C
MKIALLGAESTGKSQLALKLSARLQQSGLRVHRVDEYLREWCDIETRTPTRAEQHHIAQTQMARVLATPAGAVVIADTTPLMTAVYNQMVFDDHSLDVYALQQQALFDITLLMGLDLAWVSDGLQRVGAHVREPVDQKIRQLLAQANLTYQVVYGIGEQRLENALFCIARQAPHLAKQLERPEPPLRWSGPCESCGDGDCEHRLFSSLVKG